MSDKLNALSNEIRRVDGGHSLGAGALAEALMPWFAEELRKAKEEAWKEGMNYAMPPDAVLLYSDNPYRKTD